MSPKQAFVREATGLVREAGWFDVFMYNEAGMSFAGCMVMTTMFADIPLGGDFFTAWLLATILGVFIGLTYYLLSVTMPRTGADYIYGSRILHPALGLVAAGFMGWLAPLVNIGYGASGWILYAFAPFLTIASVLTNNPAFADLAVTLAQPQVSYTIAAITMIVWGVILAVAGLRKYFAIQNALVIFGFISAAAMLGVCLITPHSEFVTAFDAAAKGYGTSYSDIITKATEAGWTPTPRTPTQALFLVPMMLSGSWWATQSAVFSGEIKKIGKSQLIGMVLGIVAMTTLFFVIYAALVEMVGYEFGNAVAYFAFNDPSAISVPVLPYPTMFYFGLAAKNTVLTLIIALGGVIGMIMFVPWGIMIFSRYLFAMSFDRVLPEFVSKVDERLHTPVNAIALATFFSLVLMFIFQFLSTIPYAVGWIFYIGIGANELLQISVFVSAIALALLPYIRRQLYEQAFPFKRKIAGIPVATWSGLITMGILVYSQYVWFLSPPWSQMIYGGFPEIAYLCLGFGIILVLIYFAINAYRKSQAIDLSLVFKEIPPE